MEPKLYSDGSPVCYSCTWDENQTPIKYKLQEILEDGIAWEMAVFGKKDDALRAQVLLQRFNEVGGRE